jgi:hypothetical protein
LPAKKKLRWVECHAERASQAFAAVEYLELLAQVFDVNKTHGWISL